jgi:hypothetical protein
MELLAVIGTVVGALAIIIGILAGIVQIADYIEKRQDKKTQGSPLVSLAATASPDMSGRPSSPSASQLSPVTATSVAKSPEAKKAFEEEFLPRLKLLREQVRKTPLHVLVWGPGETGGLLYEKRRQIRDYLVKMGHDANFSEEIPSEVSEEDSLSQKTEEFIQARIADLIIVLQSSYGSVAEVHDFIDYESIARKLLVFIDEKACDGYSYRGALGELDRRYGNVEKYRYPEDIKECHLLTKVLKRVYPMQERKFREMMERTGA